MTLLELLETILNEVMNSNCATNMWLIVDDFMLRKHDFPLKMQHKRLTVELRPNQRGS